MIIFDSHCHPQLHQYDKDREEMLRRAKDAGIFMVCVGTDYETSKQSIKLAQKHDNMWASVGLHPNDNLNEKFNVREYEELLKMPKVVAMGEIGLDYYRTVDPNDQDFQKGRFEEQLELAVKINMPIILHSRDSGKGTAGRVHQDMISILKKFKTPDPSLLGVAHSFTGGIDDAREYLEMGFFLGFNGILTFTRQYDGIVNYVPLDRIFLETDAPFLAPEPYRGKRNEPLYVKEVAGRIAELKNIPIDKVFEQTTRNCREFFSLI